MPSKPCCALSLCFGVLTWLTAAAVCTTQLQHGDLLVVTNVSTCLSKIIAGLRDAERRAREDDRIGERSARGWHSVYTSGRPLASTSPSKLLRAPSPPRRHIFLPSAHSALRTPLSAPRSCITLVHRRAGALMFSDDDA